MNQYIRFFLNIMIPDNSNLGKLYFLIKMAANEIKFQ